MKLKIPTLSACRHRRTQAGGFTLIELLLVLLIIGVLSGVALRAIDMTRERTMYSDTTKKIYDLAKAISGNPDLIADGKRVDYGFIGDLGRLPLTINELIRNTENDTNWHGPYIKIGFLEDTLNPSYKLDAWGNPIEYSNETGMLQSRGNGRQPMTYKITDSLSFLLNNRVSGLITDNENNPPGSFSNLIDIVMNLPESDTTVHPNRSGYYQMDDIPMGRHQIRVVKRTASPESLIKWVSVASKTNTIQDFRFARSFQSKLQYVDKSAHPMLNDLSSIYFDVFNVAGETINLQSVRFQSIDRLIGDTVPLYHVFCESIIAKNFGYVSGSLIRYGNGNTAPFAPSVTIAPSAFETFTFLNFRKDSIGPSDTTAMDSVKFNLVFSDGSIINFITTQP
jgi:prepilin-type N-terminal cleavage/methylation domain-containing protein